MAKFFINHPIFAIVLSILIVTGGIISAFFLPIAQYPQIIPPRVAITGNYMGANANAVEEAVALPIELKVNGVPDMTEMQSICSDNGSYTLAVNFDMSKNADMAAVEVQNRMSQAEQQLPDTVKDAGLIVNKVSAETVMYFALCSPNNTYDKGFLKNYGDINFVEDLKRIKGVGNIAVYGGADFAMRIWLQPDRMAKSGITTNDIHQAITSQNIQVAPGKIGQLPAVPGQEFQYTVRVKGRLVKPEEFGQIIVRNNPDGSLVRLADLARVELADQHSDILANYNKGDTVIFGLQLTTDANALETVKEVKRVLAEAAEHFPNDMDYKIVIDNTNFIKESMKEVLKTFAEAFLLVVLVVFLFLQTWRATLIPLLAVPVSLIGTLTAFLFLGFSINTLTMFAMVLSIGLVVDDAIVVVEAVEHHIRYNGLSPREATIRAMNEVSGPVVAIAFVLISVFAPVAFLGGTMGVLYKQFALTVVISMALSAFVALTLTPVLCSLLLKPIDAETKPTFTGRAFHSLNVWFERMTVSYGRGVRKSIERTTVWVCFLGIMLFSIGGILKVLPPTFVPEEDQGYYLTIITLPEAVSLSRTYEVVREMGDIIRSNPVVKETIAMMGYDVLSDANKPNSGLVFTVLKPWDERKTQDLHVQAQVHKTYMELAEIPGATAMSFNFPTIQGIGSYGGFTFMLEDRGNNTIDELDRVARELIAAARKRPELGLVYTNFRNDIPSYRFEVDREKVKKIGVAVDDVFNALNVFLGGLQVNDFNSFGRTYKVIMQAEPEFRSDVSALRFLYVKNSAGTMVPLDTLVTPVMESGAAVIKRFNGFRAVQIGGGPAPGYSSGQALAALEETANEVLPQGFGYEWADISREEKEAGNKTPILFGLSLMFAFLCLAALYENWRIPFAVLLAVPAGVFGAVLFQYISNLTNNVYMQIGLITLIGLAAKNAILIVEFAKLRVDKGMNPVEAAVEAATLRLRPILMTSLAFIIGCLPLALATGAGAGARNAMGTSVVGGMIMATTVGIFLIPVLFVLIERLAGKSKPSIAKENNIGG
ncbi:Efflux pump membrane transporter BepE [Sporomusa ovata DSM 2662]|uniref:RND efflux system, inner membrane transporter CmeB n=1 Tax=Sporomusa ovata TaxID=2378 RepID=A0A0U1L043_9FIRM|nr:multidrug efflux RND transporter permease subunit [Sporomusa ovata]EQB27191.1 efflux pump membrane transporter BepG [Sporomusa ovata DSM 2662]CQR73031.1 RND efflux system, inner membrane transporter CmeB [Sporomusa ovata]